MSNWVIGQLITLENITFDYQKFKRNNDIEIIHDEVLSVSKEKLMSTNVYTANC